MQQTNLEPINWPKVQFIVDSRIEFGGIGQASDGVMIDGFIYKLVSQCQRLDGKWVVLKMQMIGKPKEIEGQESCSNACQIQLK